MYIFGIRTEWQKRGEEGKKMEKGKKKMHAMYFKSKPALASRSYVLEDGHLDIPER